MKQALLFEELEEESILVALGDAKQWWFREKLHRKYGPAVERPDGYKAWYLNGLRHRVNGPATIWPDGTKEWWLNGKRHRDDGPAVEHADGYKSWYINDHIVNPPSN